LSLNATFLKVRIVFYYALKNCLIIAHTITLAMALKT